MKAAADWIREELCLPTDWRERHRDFFPFSLEGFDLSEMWPSVFHIVVHAAESREGRLKKVFGKSVREKNRSTVRVTAQSIADTLSRDGGSFDGFADNATRSVLADLLLCRCVGNAKRNADRDALIRRIVPTHPVSGWLVPSRIKEQTGDVPPLIAELLANRDYRVGDLLGMEVLLRAFARGDGSDPDRSPSVDGIHPIDPGVDLDQLLTIRMAQKTGNSHQPFPPGEGLEHPIATNARDRFAEDINLFVVSHASRIPRHAFTKLLDPCLAVGLSTLLAGTVRALVHWKEHGRTPEHAEQKPFPLLVNCSSETVWDLQLQAEKSFDELMTKLMDVPTILMTIRLLEHALDPQENWREWSPTHRLALLGDLLLGRSPKSGSVMHTLTEATRRIEAAIERGDCTPVVLPELEEGGNPAIRLAEGLVSLDREVDHRLWRVASSVFGAGRPNGLATERWASVSRVNRGKVRRQQVVLTDTALDYLVHLFLAQVPPEPGGSGQTFGKFLGWLRDRHGIYVDQLPPGNNASSDLLRDNRLALERRMCELGVLESAHDAEEMKRVLGRFRQERAQWN